MRPLPLILAALLCAPAARAEAPAPGAVEQYLLAHRLFAAGQSARDGLDQIAGARMAAALTLRPLDLTPEVAGKGKAGAAAPLPDAAQMLAAAAQAVETDETLSILLGNATMTADLLPKATLRSAAGALAPGQSHRYRLPVDGGAATEIGLLADSPTLMLEIATESGLLCKGQALCRVTLPESGFLAVTVQNGGDSAAPYHLLTN